MHCLGNSLLATRMKVYCHSNITAVNKIIVNNNTAYKHQLGDTTNPNNRMSQSPTLQGYYKIQNILSVRLETNQIKSNVEATLSCVEMGRFIFIPTKHGTKQTLNTEIRTCLNIKKKYLMSKDE